MELLGYDTEVLSFDNMEDVDLLITCTTYSLSHEVFYELVVKHGNMDSCLGWMCVSAFNSLFSPVGAPVCHLVCGFVLFLLDEICWY